MQLEKIRILALAIALSSVCGAGHATDSGYQGLLVEPAKVIHPQAMMDHRGDAVDFPQRNERMKLVFFGYSSCPDVCPMTLQKVKSLMHRLGEAANDLEFCFVSIDPQRDNSDQLNHFVSYYDPRITGFTGEPRAIKALENEFGILTRKFQGKSAFAYTLEHSVFLYLLNGEGQLRLMYPATAPVDDIIRDIELLRVKDEDPAHG
jgi:protein SCO1/2